MTALRKISMAALAGCCLVMAQVAAAQNLQRPNASTVIKPTVSPSAVSPQAADNTLGMALMGAVINSDGTFANGSGVTSSQRFTTGGYQVIFERNIADCNYATAVVGLSFVYVRIVVHSGNQLQFNTNNIDGSALTDTTFSVTVFCHK